jgi:hypothetical protein
MMVFGGDGVDMVAGHVVTVPGCVHDFMEVTDIELCLACFEGGQNMHQLWMVASIDGYIFMLIKQKE